MDLIYYGRGRRLEYDFVIQPGGGPENIRLEFDSTPCLEADGSLRLGGFRLEAPIVYQPAENGRHPVEARYALLADGSSVDLEATAYAPQSDYGGGRTEGFLLELFRPRLGAALSSERLICESGRSRRVRFCRCSA